MLQVSRRMISLRRRLGQFCFLTYLLCRSDWKTTHSI